MNRLTTALLATLIAAPLAAEPERQPLWEVGFGVAPISFPDYRGSDQRHTYALPFPYVVYRGDVLKVDREGLRGLLYRGERVNLDVSLDGAVPVDSDQNGRRAGMPDLEPVLELGPSLKVDLWRNADERLRFDGALRGALAIGDGRVSHEGWVLHPRLDYARFGGTRVGLSAGPLFASRAFHGYYYDVNDPYATAERPAYRAEGGYSGFRITLTMNRRSGRWYQGGFLRYDDLSGVAFKDSPLVAERHALMAGFSVARVVQHSERSVPWSPLAQTESPAAAPAKRGSVGR